MCPGTTGGGTGQGCFVAGQQLPSERQGSCPEEEGVLGTHELPPLVLGTVHRHPVPHNL